MPTLAQMFSLVHAKSYYSRSDAEVYAALEEGGFNVYSAVLKEYRGTFLKVDESSITLTPGVTEYTLEADFSVMFSLAERISTTENWHRINPETLTDALTNTQSNPSWFDYGQNFGQDSQFQFYGPYLDSAAAQGSTQVQKIRISPAPTDTRFVQVAYGAKWLPITGSSSKVMLPVEGTYAMQDFAIAEACRSNDDSMAKEYEQKAEKALTRFLSWLRATLSVGPRQITPYL